MVDGAAAEVLTTKQPKGRQKAIRILGSAFQSGHQELGCEDILDAEIAARTARKAYEEASVPPADVDVVELHDAFTIAEILYYEALQLAPPAEGAGLLRRGDTALGGRVPANPSGGLLAKGHPLGATGVAQMVEITWQLQGRAADRQVEGAKIGLKQCTGGGIAGVDHAASSVHLLGVLSDEDSYRDRRRAGHWPRHRRGAGGLRVRRRHLRPESGGSGEAQARLKADFPNARILPMKVNVTAVAEVSAAVVEVHRTLRSIDVLVNDAGIVRDKKITAVNEADWDDVIDTNLESQFLTCRAVAPVMIGRGRDGLSISRPALGWAAMASQTIRRRRAGWSA